MTQAAKILVVDDEIANLRLLTDLLTRAGYQVRSSEDPGLAIESALAYPPDLILLDVMMPGMDGFEVCQRLRENELTRDIPILFVSALQDVENKVRGFEAGGVDFVSKPFEEPEVLARVKNHLQLRKMQLHLDELVAERTAELDSAKQSLQESELRFRTTFEQAAVGIAHVSVDGHFLRLNQKFCDIVGYTFEELKELTFPDITHPDDLEIDLKKVDQLLSRELETYTLEKRYYHKNGQVVWINLTVSMVWNESGEPEYFIGVIEDITERKLTEEQYYTFFAENISAVFWIEMNNPIPIDLPVEEQVDAIFREAQVKDVSESTAKMYGMTSDELKGQLAVKMWSAEAYQDWDSPLHQYYQSFVRSGYTFSLVEMPERTWDGRDLWLLISIKGVVQDGCLVRMWGSQIDITQRKIANQQIQEYQQRLKALAYQLTLSEERERRRIAAELHDHVGQSLAFSRMRLASAQKNCSDPEMLTILDEISESLLNTIRDTKNLVFELSSPLLHEIGLGEAIAEWLEDQVGDRYGLETELIDQSPNIRLDEDIRAILFRNVRELLIKRGQTCACQKSIRTIRAGR